MIYENFITYITQYICNSTDVELIQANKWIAYSLSLFVLVCVLFVVFWIVWRIFSLSSMREVITKDNVQCEDGYKIRKKKRRF